MTSERVEPVLEQIRALARGYRVAVGGAAAGASDLEFVLLLGGDVVVEATRVAALS